MILDSFFSNEIIPAAMGSSTGPGRWEGHMMNTPYGGFMMLLVGAAVIVFIILIVRGFSRKNVDASPLEILKRRYAQGEIDKETYEKMKQDIKGG
jgi:putative membrane protein